LHFFLRVRDWIKYISQAAWRPTLKEKNVYPIRVKTPSFKEGVGDIYGLRVLSPFGYPVRVKPSRLHLGFGAGVLSTATWEVAQR